MKKIMFLWMVCGFAMMTSCVSPKRITYLRDMEPEYLYILKSKPELRIETDDRLRIVISSKNPELSAPFNMGVGGYQVSTDGEVQTVTNSTMQETGYVVDRQGNIEFPILGVLHVKGLTKQELSGLIKERLKQEELINDAIVMVDLLNLKITMMGEVSSVGVLSVSDNRISLLEAIIRSGGLTPNASMGEVAVIREDGDGIRMLMNDLRTVEVLNSPGFYLQQNDIVYVKPMAAAASPKENRAWQLFNLLLGLVSTTISFWLLVEYRLKSN
jgi:polysaccharide export outer membrane protein